MTSNYKNWMALLGSMMVIGLPVLTHLQLDTTDEHSARMMLRVTAWTSFLIYLLVFVTRPMQQLLKSSRTTDMMKNRRYFGIAMAGSHTVHLILIVWFFTSVSDTGPAPQVLIFGGGGYALLYLMLLTSFDKPAAAIGPIAWRRLHKTGLYWIGFVFVVTFVPKSLTQPDRLSYLIATLLILTAIAIRIAAFLKNRRN